MVCKRFKLGWRELPHAHSLLRAAALITACLFSNIGTAQAESAAAIEERIRRHSAAHEGWKVKGMDIKAMDDLARSGCVFYSVGHTAQLDSARRSYAVLPDGTVVNGRQAGELERLLSTCGREADAPWWARLISRFASVGGLLVDSDAPSAIRRLKAKGVTDTQPSLSRSADGETIVRFYTYDYDISQATQVQARLSKDGRLSLSQTPQ